MAVAQYFVVCRLSFFNAVGLVAESIVDADFIGPVDFTDLQVRARTTELEQVRSGLASVNCKLSSLPAQPVCSA